MTDMIVLNYKGREVTFDPNARMWNLNAMYEACGSPESKEPRFWLRSVQAQELIEALEEKLKCENFSHLKQPDDFKRRWEGHLKSTEDFEPRNESLVQTRRGRYGGGTWAHWQIAAAYAHYLDPRFYLTWNEWAMAYYQGRGGEPASPALAALAARVENLAAEVAKLKARAVERLPGGRPEHITRRTKRPARPIRVDVLLAVFQGASGPLTPTDVAAALADVASYQQVRHRMQQLVGKGYLCRIAHGFYIIAPKNN